MNVCFAGGTELKCQHMPGWISVWIWRVIRHGFDCVKVLFPVIVSGEELQDS